MEESDRTGRTEQNNMISYLYCLLFAAILTEASGATPLYCSDVQSPGSGSGHNTDLSQVTTLQYCIIVPS